MTRRLGRFPTACGAHRHCAGFATPLDIDAAGPHPSRGGTDRWNLFSTILKTLQDGWVWLEQALSGAPALAGIGMTSSPPLAG